MMDTPFRKPFMVTEPLSVCHLDGEVVVYGMGRIEGSLTPEAATGTAHRLLAVVEELSRVGRT